MTQFTAPLHFKKQLIGAAILALVITAGACKPDPGPTPPIEEEPYIDPIEGPVYGGTRMTVHAGTADVAFAQGMRVRIGEAECLDVQIVSEKEMSCATSASAEGTFDVKVLKSDQFEPVITIPAAFQYLCTGEAAAGAVIWANDGGDKVVQEDARATCDPFGVHNSVWDGAKISVFGAKDEVVNFNLVIEASQRDLTGVTVELDSLTGPNGTVLSYSEGDADSIFNYTNRQIELFYVRYLKVKGLSRTAYRAASDSSADERHVPHRFRRDYELEGFGVGTWTDRPDHDKSYPDIAVPLELENVFTVEAGRSQSIWVDVYIPRGAPSGLYTGAVVVKENGATLKEIPVELTVRGFALPLEPTAKTMVSMGYGDINQRYVGERYPHESHTDGAKLDAIRERHFMMAHRHKLSIVDQNDGRAAWNVDAPRPEWLPRLNGTLFTAANGYEGPGMNTGNGVYAIGLWGQWGWRDGDEAEMRSRLDAYETWFAANAPASADRILFLEDEPENMAQVEQWAQWVNANPGVGSNIKALATTSLLNAVGATASMPSLDIAATFFQVGLSSTWQAAHEAAHASGKQFYMYNNFRPASGTLVIEDDGVSPRQMGWAQFKMGVDRWMYWDSTYYLDNKYTGAQNDVFNVARTFGDVAGFDPVLGENGRHYSNGWGVLFYPGTDRVYAGSSYGINGPIASLRMKHWRRGIQDADYLALARSANPAAANAILQRVVPKALWENGVSDLEDPTWLRADISWQIDPNVWEAARKELADIIEGAN